MSETYQTLGTYGNARIFIEEAISFHEDSENFNVDQIISDVFNVTGNFRVDLLDSEDFWTFAESSRI